MISAPASSSGTEMERIVIGIAGLLLAVIIVVVAGALVALPVMWLWNWLLTGPESAIGIGLPVIGFWRSWGLLVLCGLLFKSSNTTSSK